jgi:NAD(P)-dependent dehydrogenase (short-subunit alcohol dehydrogenase family)
MQENAPVDFYRFDLEKDLLFQYPGCMKHVLITGSTKGIGFGMAREFLKLGFKVTVSGRSKENLEKAVSTLAGEFGQERVQGFSCDVGDAAQVDALLNGALKKHGRIDIWINNEGLGHARKNTWDLSRTEIDEVVRTNITGMINGTTAAYRHMTAQGGGAIYNMEGFGSDGMVMAGMSIYGMSKRALTYFTKSMIAEAGKGPVLIGMLSPGMVITDLLTRDFSVNPEEAKRTRRIYNILADRVETVTPFLARKIALNVKQGASIRWLTGFKVFLRFMTAGFIRRKVVD